jgi:hypothetical protein
MNRNIGMTLLAVYLILVGLSTFVAAISGLGPVLPILALLSGILILLGR